MELPDTSPPSKPTVLARFIAALSSPFTRRNSGSDPKAGDPRHRLGREGERIAERYLRKHGYKILYRNFRARHGGEVDLVCRDVEEATLVFVEVKTRRTDAYGRPAEAVTRDKEALIARGARAWLQMLDRPDVPFRFDIVEVIMGDGEPRITVIKSAFQLPETQRR